MNGKQARKLQTMSRRRFLKTLSGLGASGLALTEISQESLAKLTDNPEEEIPIVEKTKYKDSWNGEGKPQRERVLTTVPREKYLHVNAVENAAKNLSSQITSSGVGVGVTRRDPTKNNTERMVVVEHVTRKERTIESGEIVTREHTPSISFDSLERKTPSKVSASAETKEHSLQLDNIPVEVRQVEEKDTHHGGSSHFDDKYRPLCGGVAVTNAGGIGTCAYHAWNPGSSQRDLIVSGHQTVGNEGNPMSQGGGEIGLISDGRFKNCSGNSTVDFDSGILGLKANIDLKFRMGSPYGNYQSEPVNGIKNWDWIRYQSDGVQIMKQGYTTGIQRGNVSSILDACDGHQRFVSTCVSKDGDSGGPVYVKENGNIYLLGQNEQNRGDSYSAANSFEDIESTLGVMV